VLLARKDTSTYLIYVAMLEWYLATTGICQGSDVLLFTGIIKTKNREKLRDSGPLSYTTVRRQFRSKLIQVGYLPERSDLLQQLKLVYLIACSNNMVVGNQKWLKIAMLKTLKKTD